MAPMRSAARLGRTLALAGSLTVALTGCFRAAPSERLSPRLTDREYLRALHLMVPVAGTRPDQLRDSFDGRRGDNGEREHQAIDILAPRGTPVLAAVDGDILRVSSNQLGGKTVYATDRGHRFVYYYAHLDRYAERTSVGARVKQGDIIGYVGTTGNAPKDIPHLHFQVMHMVGGHQWWEGPPVDPFGLFARPGAPN